MLPELLASLLEMGGRTGFNPLEELKDNPTWAYGFLAIRFFGLVVVVADHRGVLPPRLPDALRHGHRLAADSVRRGQPPGADRGASAFPMLTHPERLAAAAWFSMVTWLMLRTQATSGTASSPTR